MDHKEETRIVRETMNRVISIAQSVTGRNGDYSGRINVQLTEANAHLIVTAVNHFEEMRGMLEDTRLNPPCDGASREDTYHWFADFEFWCKEARALLAKIKEETETP